MLAILTDGRFPIMHCPGCNTTFTGPKARHYYTAHLGSPFGA